MTSQESITNALASGSTAALVTVLVLAVLVWLGADWAMNTLDVHLPVRQLMLGRSGQALAMHGRVAYTLLIARVGEGGATRA